ncbi:Nn.00g043850.m01.CDS01 [Neocucurbitaria sp. VM-36]
MDQLPNHYLPTSGDRWEQLKPVIEQLYLKDKRKLAEVVSEMKNKHKFDAVEHQYKHHFKKWQWKKNIPTSEKKEIKKRLESRARAGKRGTDITFEGRPVELHKMRRYMKKEARNSAQDITLEKPFDTGRAVAGPALPFANTIFLKWNMPYAAMCRLLVRPFDYVSPLRFSNPTTPGSDISVASPPCADSPLNAPSPTAVVMRGTRAIERANLFARGQHDKLLMSLNGEEKRVMSDWLYQYWLFCFKTSKHWGRGPRAWTAELLDFARFHDRPPHGLPETPQDSTPHSEGPPEDSHMPLTGCRWFIHVREEPDSDEILEEESFHNPIIQDLNDESTWSPWPNAWQEPPLPSRLRDALEHNDFSSIPTASLPVAIPQIAKAAQKSPDELLLESLGFSIISRNLEQVSSIMRQIFDGNIDFKSLYPLHMATSYLDGYKACCDIVRSLLFAILDEGPVQVWRELWVNELGHTVLDNLMISILKSHSSALPIVFDSTLKDTPRFIGDEVDICGRWDADSACVRHLFANGHPSIPSTWKHKFCHTSIQTICHCITTIHDEIFLQLSRHTTSWLYVRRCFDCGLKLQLQPLHSLVMTAYHLADNGCQDEDLFGILACLLCLVSCGHDPRKTANVSVTALTQTDVKEIMCDHEELTPAKLAEEISSCLTGDSWSEKTRSGWAVLCGVLRLCEDYHASPESDEDNSEAESAEDYRYYFIGTGEPRDAFIDLHVVNHSLVHCFDSRRDLATLWASVQAELLSYRRLDEHMDWISDRFSMERLKGQLERGEPLSVGYADQDLLQLHCTCGRFDAHPFATVSDATNPDIENLDMWDRATYGTILE